MLPSLSVADTQLNKSKLETASSFVSVVLHFMLSNDIAGAS